jgi:hypothetical protein
VASLPDLRVPVVGLAGALEPTGNAAQAPATAPPSSGPPTWVQLSGIVSRDASGAQLASADATHRLDDDRCEPSPLPDAGPALVQGIGVADPARLVVACDGVRLASTLTDGAAAAPQEGAPRAAVAVRTSAARVENVASTLALLLASVTAAAGFGYVLVRRGEWPRRRGTMASEAEEPSGTAVDEGDDEAAGPALTLVPLPRERGSP